MKYHKWNHKLYNWPTLFYTCHTSLEILAVSIKLTQRMMESYKVLPQIIRLWITALFNGQKSHVFVWYHGLGKQVLSIRTKVIQNTLKCLQN